MSQPVLIKAYGNLWPADADLAAALRQTAADCLPKPKAPVIGMQGDLLTISFEGIYFPAPDFLNVIERLRPQTLRGKLDVLDIENWRLERHIFADGKTETRCAPLNDVLAYSGH